MSGAEGCRDAETARFDALRAENHTVLAALLARAPDAGLLAQLAEAVPAYGGELGEAWQALRAAAASADPRRLADEYQNLFIGVGRGELVPYMSWYRTGNLMDQPLIRLREDLARLGVARQDEVRDPEDHIAALSEVMAMLAVDDELVAGYPVQQAFYNAHIAPVIERFWRDLEVAKSADFYRVVARLGAAFHALERQYFTLTP